MALQLSSTVQTAYQRVEVWKSAASCELRVAGAAHAWWHRDRYLAGRAWDTLAAAALLRPAGPPASLLMLGLAGGTTLRILRRLLPDCRFTAVDIDAELVELARRHMELDELRVEVHVADAYEWANAQTGRYDVIIDDCYLAGPERVFRPEGNPERGVEMFGELMNPGGLLLANVLTAAGHRRMLSRTRAAFRRGFAAVSAVTTPESESETVVGGSGVLPVQALKSWTSYFPQTKDREFWSWLDVKVLQ